MSTEERWGLGPTEFALLGVEWLLDGLRAGGGIGILFKCWIGMSICLSFLAHLKAFVFFLDVLGVSRFVFTQQGWTELELTSSSFRPGIAFSTLV
jgi:hypothetical protein